MPYKLTDLVVQEVSIVDEPANKRRFVVVKQAPEAKLRGIAEAIDSLLPSVPEGDLRGVLEAARATVALRLGEAVEGAQPFPSLEHAADAIEVALEGVEDAALREKVEEVLDLIDDFLASVPTGYAYPLPLGKEEGNTMADGTRARATVYYGPAPYYGYPYACPPYSYPYAYPYAYPKLPKDAAEAIGKLEAALAEVQNAVAGLKAILVSKTDDGQAQGATAQAEPQSEPQAEPAAKSESDSDEADLAAALGEVEKAVQALAELQKSVLTKAELEEMVRKEVQATLA